MTMTQIEASDLHKIGPICVTGVGEENFYFTLANGTRCYCKVEGYAHPDRTSPPQRLDENLWARWRRQARA